MSDRNKKTCLFSLFSVRKLHSVLPFDDPINTLPFSSTSPCYKISISIIPPRKIEESFVEIKVVFLFFNLLFLSLCMEAKMKPLFSLSLCFVMVGSAMAAEADSSSSRDLDQTPTWAVACVCAVFIIISIALEKILHKLGTVCLYDNNS